MHSDNKLGVCSTDWPQEVVDSREDLYVQSVIVIHYEDVINTL